MAKFNAAVHWLRTWKCSFMIHYSLF